ncbi:hypothetical protein [Sphingopyxis yananensis]|uniref:hypothetical protein n=1 Tax=Sphingopyxis yananensis TaxID=2886687 RepID=UPI001D104CED|nr:hypothetical protein [Sphingopyxis yananensis]MCC2603024.1 hypothetical protein [Sphingopyxis yananensis]
MSDVQTKIGKYNPETRTVPVTFTSGAIIHNRDVNAMLTDAGRYDADATAARVADVANGVAHKIACGAITADPA